MPRNLPQTGHNRIPLGNEHDVAVVDLRQTHGGLIFAIPWCRARCLLASALSSAKISVLRIPNIPSINQGTLTEKLDTSSPTGKLAFHVFAALAEFERHLIRERTLAGLKAARARGRQGGRPRKLQPKELKTIRALLKTAEVSVQEIATRFGVSLYCHFPN